MAISVVFNVTPGVTDITPDVTNIFPSVKAVSAHQSQPVHTCVPTPIRGICGSRTSAPPPPKMTIYDRVVISLSFITSSWGMHLSQH